MICIGQAVARRSWIYLISIRNLYFSTKLKNVFPKLIANAFLIFHTENALIGLYKV